MKVQVEEELEQHKLDRIELVEAKDVKVQLEQELQQY